MDFLKDNPTAIIVNVGPGEGDNDTVYYHIKYRKSSKETIFESVWMYQRDENGTWKVKLKNIR